MHEGIAVELYLRRTIPEYISRPVLLKRGVEINHKSTGCSLDNRITQAAMITAVRPILIGEDMKRSGLAIWRDALAIGLKVASRAIWALPLLCVPIMGDVLSSILVREEMKTSKLKASEIVRESFSKSRKLFMVKFYFEFRSFLWAFIPIIGYIKALRHRQYWAMASNVLIFESQEGRKAIERCKEIIDGNQEGVATRALVTIPIILGGLMFAFYAVVGTTNEKFYFPGFIVLLVVTYFIAVPFSGIINTMLYLSIEEKGTV
jgi:hypothetical protein